ncbi:MAG TPA: DUF1697 domain-containing protein [Acidimicrobiales bacterium]|nr:DUF1697 domain-containing protein [Acidimicrobiales bacterium]
MSDPSRTWAVLLRGVNVGGHRRLGMADLLAAGRRELFAFTPAGLGRSRVLTGVERALGVPVTVRNLATVQAVAALCGDRP